MTMKVPLLDLTAQYAPIRDEVLAAIVRVCDSQRFILGPEVEALERELAALLDVQHAIGVSSGTDALLVAMMALGIGPGDEVITPTYSFFATAGCVVAPRRDAGVRRHRPGHLQRRSRRPSPTPSTPRTKAIIPVHLYGQSADMDPILDDRPPRRGVAGHRGRRAGHRRAVQGPRRSAASGRSAASRSFPSKNLGAFGDGGLVTTNDAGAGAARSGCCATTAPSRSTTITSSAATSGSTRCRRPCCA